MLTNIPFRMFINNTPVTISNVQKATLIAVLMLCSIAASPAQIKSIATQIVIFVLAGPKLANQRPAKKLEIAGMTIHTKVLTNLLVRMFIFFPPKLLRKNKV